MSATVLKNLLLLQILKFKKNLRSRLESIWRANKTTSNRAIYKTQARKVAKLITKIFTKILFYKIKIILKNYGLALIPFYLEKVPPFCLLFHAPKISIHFFRIFYRKN